MLRKKTPTFALALSMAVTLSAAELTDRKTAPIRRRPLPLVLTTQTCGATTIPLNSEEPTCNSHNGRWVSVTETGPGSVAYWLPTPLAHPTFVYSDGVVGLPDGGTYLITTEVPVASDCGVTLTARLKVAGMVVDSQTSPGGNRILRHRFVYVKSDPESVTDAIEVEIVSSGGYGYAQGVVLDLQRTDIN
jgi:hypothetical protein